VSQTHQVSHTHDVLPAVPRAEGRSHLAVGRDFEDEGSVEDLCGWGREAPSPPPTVLPTTHPTVPPPLLLWGREAALGSAGG
jgi:hypothetical protein